MKNNLLLHSLGEFASITLPILEAIKAKSACEIGTEYEGHSKILYIWAEYTKSRFYSIDPAPQIEYANWVKETNRTITYLPENSLDAIPAVGAVDAWFLNSDHNWYTVFHDLSAIYTLTRSEGEHFLAFIHHVNWPCARRDFYLSPDKIPTQYKHPFSWELGATLDKKELVAGGFRGVKRSAVALHEGGEQNGVLTAIEDFVASHPSEFYWAMIPAVFGLGVLFDRDHPYAETIIKILAPFNESPLLAELEKNRLKNALKMIELESVQDECMITS